MARTMKLNAVQNITSSLSTFSRRDVDLSLFFFYQVETKSVKLRSLGAVVE